MKSNYPFYLKFLTKNNNVENFSFFLYIYYNFYTKSLSYHNRARHMKWLNEYNWLKHLK